MKNMMKSMIGNMKKTKNKNLINNKAVLSLSGLMLFGGIIAGSAAPAMAAEAVYPVYLEGTEQIGSAIVRNETTYLPMRQLLEAFGAEVNWDGASRTVTAVESDGVTLTYPLDGEYATMQYSESSSSNFYGGDYVERDSRIYLPVRFIADAYAYEVEWSAADKAVYISYPKVCCTGDDGASYIMNLLNGQLTRWDADGSSKILGELSVVSRRGFISGRISSIYVSRTEGGNYLVNGGGLLSGALTNDLKMYAWLPKDGGESYITYTFSVFDQLPEIVTAGSKIYLPGRGEAICIDDATGTVTKCDITGIYKDKRGEELLYSLYWANERYLLFGDGTQFDVYDTVSKTLVSMKDKLVTEDIKREVYDKMVADSFYEPADSERYWQMFGYTLGIPAGDFAPYMQFVGEEDGNLVFELCCTHYVKDESGAIGMDSLKYTLVWPIA